jgi:peptide/nickel transport system substrate-binding protein
MLWPFAFLAWLAAVSDAGAVDLRFGAKGLPVSLGNPYAANGSPGTFVWSAMYDGLTRLDKDGAIAPALATAWKNVAPTAWQFTLRRGVAFSNGEPFTADAVVAALAWLRTLDGARTVVGNEIRGVTGAEAVDDATVIVRTARPDPILPARLSSVMIVAPAAWRELGPDAFARSPAGTGPFAVKDWGGGAKATLAANPESWRRPKVDRLIVVNLPDNATRMQALLSGQVEIAGNVDVEDLDTLEAANMIAAVAPGMSTMSIAFRQEGGGHPALKDVRVRQAINYAVDKDTLNKALLRGLGPASGQPAARGVTGHNPDVRPYPFDLAKAKALMAEAGYGDGFPMRIDVMVDRSPADRAIFQSVAAALGKIGIAVELRTVTVGAWMDAYLSGAWDKETDAFILSFNAAPYNDVARPLEIYSCLRPNGFTCDRALTAKIVAANEEMEPAKRLNRLGELAQLFHDAAPALYLTELFDIFALSRKVEGFALANRVPVYETIAIRK